MNINIQIVKQILQNPKIKSAVFSTPQTQICAFLIGAISTRASDIGFDSLTVTIKHSDLDSSFYIDILLATVKSVSPFLFDNRVLFKISADPIKKSYGLTHK